MTIGDVERRVARLTELSGGLDRERSTWEKAQDPLLYLERKAYLIAIRQAIAGVETARVTLVKVALRLRAERAR